MLGVVQLVGVHTDFACGSMIKGCADSGIVGILEINTILVISTTAYSIDIGLFVQVCSIGDRNSSAVIQISNAVLDIRNVYHKIVLTFKIVSINGILRRIFGDIIGRAIGFNDYTIESVISNAFGQSISEANSVIIIVIVSTVGACGQLSDQLELELFVDCMVSGTAPTTSRANVVVIVVINFFSTVGFTNLGLIGRLNFPLLTFSRKEL